MPSQPPTLDLRRPFTRAQAIAAGIHPEALRGSRFRRVFHGVYVHSSVTITAHVRVEAALLVHPSTAFASHASSAVLYRLPVELPAGEHVSVFQRADKRRVDHLRHHLAPPNTPVRVVEGLRVSAPEQLFCELAEQLGLVDLVVVGDALVRWHGTSPEALVKAAATARPRARRSAKRAAAYVRRGVDSPMESRLRMLMVLAGLPEPKVNHTIYWDDGSVRFRFDLSYPELKVIIEYDGRQHRADLDQWDADISRRDWMDAGGWSFVPVVARGVYQRPDETLDRVRDVLVRAGARGLPARLSDDWRPYFPVRG